MRLDWNYIALAAVLIGMVVMLVFHEWSKERRRKNAEKVSRMAQGVGGFYDDTVVCGVCGDVPLVRQAHDDGKINKRNGGKTNGRRKSA
jgi:hypothetical protein